MLGSLPVLGLAAALFFGAAGAAAAPGPVIAIGGALRGDNAAVWSRIVQAAGGAGATVAVLPTASAEPQASGQAAAEHLRRHGAVADVLPLAAGWPGGAGPRAADDAALAARIDAAGGVFFTGGQQALITAALRPDGRETAVLRAIRALHARGGVVAGTSAGAAVMSAWMIRDVPAPARALTETWQAGRHHDRGLGFIAAPLLVDQHFLERQRLPRLLAALQATGEAAGLGVDEDTAAVVHGGTVEAVGRGHLLWVDLRQAERGPGPQLRGAQVLRLQAGDRLDLAAGTVTRTATQTVTAAARLPERRDTQQPGTVAQVLDALQASDGSGPGAAWAGPVGRSGWQLCLRRDGPALLLDLLPATAAAACAAP